MNNTFSTVINCMDGRIQSCVNDYVSKSQNTKYIDTITLAGPSKVISENTKDTIIDNLKFRLDISIKVHESKYIAIVGHFDCAGVRESDNKHREHIVNSATIIRNWYPNIKVEALWVTEDLEVKKL